MIDANEDIPTAFLRLRLQESNARFLLRIAYRELAELRAENARLRAPATGKPIAIKKGPVFLGSEVERPR